jgi:hypothetical protein
MSHQKGLDVTLKNGLTGIMTHPAREKRAEGRRVFGIERKLFTAELPTLFQH